MPKKMYRCKAVGYKELYVIANSQKRAKSMYRRYRNCPVGIECNEAPIDVDEDERECAVFENSALALSYGVEYGPEKRI